MSRLLVYYNGMIFSQTETGSELVTSSELNGDFFRVFDQWVRHKINYRANNLVVVLYSGYTNKNTNSIRKFIKLHRINKIYFFIEDVFRLECEEPDFNFLETYCIEQFPDTTTAIELDIIKDITKKIRIPFEVYHCEYNAKFFSEKYNINIKYFDWYISNLVINHRIFPVANTKFNYKIACFNLRREYHRYLIAILLYKFPETIITCNFKMSTDLLLKNQALKLHQFSGELIGKILKLHDEIDYDQLVWDIPSTENHVTISPQHQWQNLKIIKDSFLTVSTETRFCSPMPYFTEKTLKPIMVCRPFILLAPPGTLSLLKSLGLKSFDRWWDESYDSILDHNQRLEAVYNLCLDILSKPREELEFMLEEMKDILLHNVEALNHLPEKMFGLN